MLFQRDLKAKGRRRPSPIIYNAHFLSPQQNPPASEGVQTPGPFPRGYFAFPTRAGSFVAPKLTFVLAVQFNSSPEYSNLIVTMNGFS